MSDDLSQSMMRLNRALQKANGKKDYTGMKAIANTILAGAGFYISIKVMENGWGLQVQSWYWVIGGFAAAVALTIIQRAIGES